MALDKNIVMREAQKFVAKGQYEKAIAEWKKLLRESPHDANLYNTIGDLYLKKDAKADAVEAYRQAADILASDGFMSKAIALHKKALNIDPRNIAVHLAIGDLNAEKGLTSNALEHYKIAADHYMQQKNIGKALGVYQKMADLNPANVSFRIRLADMYAKQEMVAEATKAYLDAADVHLSKHEFNEARQLLEKVLTLDPANKSAYYKAGIVYIKEGKFIEACKALRPAFENDPDNRELADTYVEALISACKDIDAEQVLRKIVDADPGRTDALEKLYTIYLAREDYDKALDAASNLAEAFVTHDAENAAEEFLKKFIAACPHYTPGRLKLAGFYITIRRDDDAARIFFQTAEILYDKGELDEAKIVLGRALDIDPKLPGASELSERLNKPIIRIPPSPEPEEPQAPSASAELTEGGPAVQEPAMPVWETSTEIKQAVNAPIAESPTIESPVSAPAEVLDPAITEAFTEADVLVKYGLSIKALEQLENLARKFPDSIQIRIKLSDLYGDLGQMNNAAVHMRALADLYTARGMHDKAQETLRTAMAIDPSESDGMDKLHDTPSTAVPEALAGTTTPEEPPALETTPPLYPLPTIEPIDSPFPAVSPELDIAPSVPEGTTTFQEPAPTDERVFESFDENLQQEGKEAPTEEPLSAELMSPTEPAIEPFVEEGPPIIEQPLAEVTSQAFTEEFTLSAEEPVMDVTPQVFAQDTAHNEEVMPNAVESISDIEPRAFVEETEPVEEVPASVDESVTEIDSQAFVEETAPVEEVLASVDESIADIHPQTIIEEAEKSAPFVEEPAPVEEIELTDLETADAEAISEQVVDASAQEPAANIDIDEVWSEGEFYYQQGLFNEAKKHYAKIIELDPNEQQAIARLSEILREEEETKEFLRLADAIEGLEGNITADPTGQELPLTASDEQALRSLMSEIARLKKPTPMPVPPPLTVQEEKIMSPGPPKVQEGLLAEAAGPPEETSEEEFFDLGEELQKENRYDAARQPDEKSEDFFDLATELRDELSGTAVPAGRTASAEEQSLNEIFEEFKRGIEQSTKEEVDTHYNLGVAYKEMGLLDDAITEFSLTPEGEPKFVLSRYMLGLCYMEKGEFENAISEIEHALAYSENTNEDKHACVEMRYDLGLAYQGAGNISSALREFQKVQSINPRYRDIAVKLKELKKGDFISIDQLKDDIDKEISSKFLEEGERIEREEKKRKNEKVRN